MPSISLVRETVGFDSRGSGFCNPCPSRIFAEMSASSAQPTIDPTSSANVTQIQTSIINSLLADTPPFAIGLLGFAAFTFFLIMKKVNLASLYLLSSVLLTFFGALIDIALLYLLHQYSTNPDQQSISSLTVFREILFSIASALRFLFYWVFVAQPPLCEQDSARFLNLHSGSWLRWGVTGSILRWTTLAASLSVFLLQALWRTVNRIHGFGPVYDIEGAVEITISAIFIVKLFLNVLLVEVSSRRQTLWQYSSVLSALVINMGIGIGNLTHFAFSELTLGRLLLAAEFQILVVSTMVFAFYSTDTKIAEGSKLASTRRRASSFHGLHLSLYDAGPLINPNRASRTQSRPPLSPSMSSWIGQRSRPPSQFELQDEKSERGLDAYRSDNAILAVTNDMVSDGEQTPRWNGPVYPSSIVNSVVAYPIVSRFSEGLSSPALSGQFPVGSAYDARKASSTSAPGAVAVVGLPDSPVLGSDDIDSTRKTTRSSPPTRQLSDASLSSSRASDYEHLFREQIELERSIDALRKSAPLPMGSRSEDQADNDRTPDLPERNTVRESSTTGNGYTSASGKSDFSLSIFPEPPQVRQFEEDYRGGRQSSLSSLVPPRLSIFSTGGFPTSNRGSVDGTTLAFGYRATSVGTRYDVTSFIGDLSSPEGSLIQTQAQPWPSDSESDPGSAIQATIVTVERTTSVSRPRLMRGSSLIDPSTSAISRGGELDRPSVREAATDTPSQEQFSPSSTLTILPSRAVFNPGAALRPLNLIGSPKRAVGLPSGPKTGFSPSANRQIGDVVATPVPGPVPVVTEGP